MIQFTRDEIGALQQDLYDEAITYPFYILERRLNFLTLREAKRVKAHYRNFKKTGDSKYIELLDEIISNRADAEDDPWA